MYYINIKNNILFYVIVKKGEIFDKLFIYNYVIYIVFIMYKIIWKIKIIFNEKKILVSIKIIYLNMFYL